jgi:hypothetical protein
VNFGAIEVVPRKERSSRCDEYILEVVRENKEIEAINQKALRIAAETNSLTPN